MPNILPSPFSPKEDIEIHIEGVEKLVQNINPSKAAGPDGIEAIFLKETGSETSAVLTHFFTQSLRNGILPRDWKQANISPVFVSAWLLTQPLMRNPAPPNIPKY